MCRVECSSFARSASPYSCVEALVMPSNRHCERSTGVVSVLVKVKSVPLPTTMSVRVPPLSILIRRSMIVPFRLGERRAAGLGLEAVTANVFEAATANVKSAGCPNGVTCPIFGQWPEAETRHIWDRTRVNALRKEDEIGPRAAVACGHRVTHTLPGMRGVSHSDTPKMPQNTESHSGGFQPEGTSGGTPRG